MWKWLKRNLDADKADLYRWFTAINYHSLWCCWWRSSFPLEKLITAHLRGKSLEHESWHALKKQNYNGDHVEDLGAPDASSFPRLGMIWKYFATLQQHKAWEAIGKQLEVVSTARNGNILQLWEILGQLHFLSCLLNGNNWKSLAVKCCSVSQFNLVGSAWLVKCICCDGWSTGKWGHKFAKTSQVCQPAKAAT